MSVLSAERVTELQAGNISRFRADNIHHRTAECDTPLHILVRTGHVDAASQCLRDYHANPFLFNDTHKSPFELALDGGHYGLALEMLRTGPAVPGGMLTRWVNDATRRHGEAADPEAQTRTLYALVNRMCGIDISTLLTEDESEWRHCYVAHLLEFKGKTAAGHNLEYFFQEKFLPLRLYHWLQVLINLKQDRIRAADMPVIETTVPQAGAGATVAAPPESRQISASELEEKLLGLIEQALTSYLIRRIGKLLCPRADKADMLKAFSVGICKLIRGQADGMQVVLPLTWVGNIVRVRKGDGSIAYKWGGHAVYLSCAKRGASWQVWMNNRGHGSNNTCSGVPLHVGYTPASGLTQLRPRGIAAIRNRELWNHDQPAGKFIQAVVQQAFYGTTVLRPMYPDAQACYYDVGATRHLVANPAAGIDPLDTSTWLGLPAQRVGNCVLASHDAAIFQGLSPAVFHWLRRYETHYSGAEAERTTIPAVPLHPYGDASTISHYEKESAILDQRWQGSPEELEDYLRAVLTEKHRKYRTGRLLDDESATSDYYVPLSLAHASARTEAQERRPCSNEQVAGEGIRLAYVQGEAGAGKSTWCAQMAKQWAEANERPASPRGVAETKSEPLPASAEESKDEEHGTVKLWSVYDWVFVIPVYKLVAEHQKLSRRGETMNRVHLWKLGFDNINVSEKLLALDAFAHSAIAVARTLYLFDGIDEVDIDTELGVELRRLFDLGTAIVTSRPRPFPWPDLAPDVSISLEGFSTKQRDQYVTDYLGEPGPFESVIARYAELTAISHNPVQLEMLCYLIEKDGAAQLIANSELTLTDVYQKIFHRPEIRKRWFYKPLPGQRSKGVLAKVAARVAFSNRCAQLSWQANSRILLPEQVHQAYEEHASVLEQPLETVLRGLGIWHPVSRSHDITQQRWEYPHRSLQEYATAVAYAELFQGRVEPSVVLSIQQRFLEDSTSLVLPYLIGLLTRPPLYNKKNQKAARKLCASVRPSDKIIDLNPSVLKSSDRLADDSLWFKCLTEIPQAVVLTWSKLEVLSWGWTDWFATRRLKHTTTSAKLLKCTRFIAWAATHVPELSGELKMNFLEWYGGNNVSAITMLAILQARPEILATRHDSQSVLAIAACKAGQLVLLKHVVEKAPGLLNEKAKEGRTVLHAAAGEHGDLVNLKWLWEQAPELRSEKTNDGQTVLHASVHGNLETVKWLWEQAPGMRLKKDHKGQKVLHAAAAAGYGSLENLKWLWEQAPGMRLEKDHQGQTVLHAAAGGHGALANLKWLWAKAPGLLTEKANEGQTVLHIAARYGPLENLKWLWAQAPELRSEKANGGQTVLHAAAVYGHLEKVKWLWEQAPGMRHMKDYRGRMVLHAAAGAAGYGNLEKLKWLWKQTPWMRFEKDHQGETVLHLAAGGYGSLEKLKWLWAQAPGMRLEKDHQGQTVLHAAARHGPLVKLKWLWGQAPELRSEKANGGRTVLHDAARYGLLVKLKWLWGQASELRSEKADGGQTVMHAAASGHGSLEKVKWLCEQASGMQSEKTIGGQTELHAAAGYHSLENLQRLWEHASDELKSQKDSSGRTVLHVAAVNDNLEMVKWLWEQASELRSEKTNGGQTVLHAANVYGNLEMVKWLWERASDELKSQKDSTGQSVLHAANVYGNLEMVKWLWEHASGELKSQKNSQGRTVLHVAVRGRMDMVKLLCARTPELLFERTSENKLPIDMTTNDDVIAYLQIKMREHAALAPCRIGAGHDGTSAGGVGSVTAGAGAGSGVSGGGLFAPRGEPDGHSVIGPEDIAVEVAGDSGVPKSGMVP